MISVMPMIGSIGANCPTPSNPPNVAVAGTVSQYPSASAVPVSGSLLVMPPSACVEIATSTWLQEIAGDAVEKLLTETSDPTHLWKETATIILLEKIIAVLF